MMDIHSTVYRCFGPPSAVVKHLPNVRLLSDRDQPRSCSPKACGAGVWAPGLWGAWGRPSTEKSTNMQGMAKMAKTMVKFWPCPRRR